MSHSQPQADGASTDRMVLVAIATLCVAYLVALLARWPQQGTEMIVGHGPAGQVIAAEAAELAPAHEPADHVQEATAPPPVWTVTPFVLLLGAIAVFPLWGVTHHWWESNRNRFLLAALLGLVTLAYYLCVHPHPVERHFLGHAVVMPAPSGLSLAVTWAVLQNAILNEFVPFIVLLFSLYTICGGIRIEGDLRAHPAVNSTFLAIGALLASLIGTTGAAMLLVRPLLETNRERKHVAHTAVFFIFMVCNCGGCLTPLGDPPLFLGYLQGVDFLWTLRLWPEWLLVNGALLLTYFLWDHFYAYPRESKTDIALDERLVSRLKFSGAGLNGVLLGLLILSVAFLDPSKPVPGTQWHPWLYLREMVQLTLVALSLGLGAAAVRTANRFNYAAIVEVAALFFGIFICMQPALQILDTHGPALGLDTPAKFFWATGSLSAVLDNAPTYLVFFETARSLPSGEGTLIAGVAEPLLRGISLGAVFMGAMTYIGNGPNFMVKAIAESSGVKMPGFFGYVVYSMAILLPLLILTSLLRF